MAADQKSSCVVQNRWRRLDVCLHKIGSAVTHGMIFYTGVVETDSPNAGRIWPTRARLNRALAPRGILRGPPTSACVYGDRAAKTAAVAHTTHTSMRAARCFDFIFIYSRLSTLQSGGGGGVEEAEPIKPQPQQRGGGHNKGLKQALWVGPAVHECFLCQQRQPAPCYASSIPIPSPGCKEEGGWRGGGRSSTSND